ncbi:MAG: type II toxin-antitoxin system death-on-curing family toxin [Clostridia bacterium]
MIILSANELISIHSQLIFKTGGLDGLRDINLLYSAIDSMNNSFDGFEQYPSVEEKAARVAYGIISNHAFIDGNKRTGVIAMLMTLELNDIKVDFSQKELISLGLAIADGSAKFEEIFQWINEHKV